MKKKRINDNVNNNIKVSIIVPIYNVKKYLVECLESIINQTLTDIEIICGDGGSTDGSLEILKDYEKKDSRIKIISKKGSGYGQSVNECIKLATGDYIGIVESDDCIDLQMYETLYGIAKQDDLDWIRSDIFFYYPNRKKSILVQDSIIYGQNYYNVVLNPQTDSRPFRSALRTWAGIYKRSFLKKFNISHNETPGASFQDVGFYLKTLFYADRVYFLNKSFYKWRQNNPNSSIHYDSKKLVEKSLNEWQINKDYLLKNKNTSKRMWGGFNYRRYFSFLWTIQMANETEKECVTKYAKKELRYAILHGQIQKNFFGFREWIRFLLFVL